MAAVSRFQPLPSPTATSSPSSLSRCESIDSMTSLNDSLHDHLPINCGTSTPSSGPTAFNDPENVKRIVVVAFGAFDRYYVCWEDTDGQYRQESHKLPERLEAWLFPPNGSTRDFNSLQVSLGYNDEFVAFDQFGKISNPDSPQSRYRNSVSITTTASPTTMAPLSAHRKSYTMPSVSPSSETLPMRLERKKSDPLRRERRQSFIVGGGISATTKRSSWQEKRSSLMISKEGLGLRTQCLDRIPSATGYVDASVQTDVIEEEEMERPASFNSPIHHDRPIAYVQHPVVSIGSMQDFCRMHRYQLGDALLKRF